MTTTAQIPTNLEDFFHPKIDIHVLPGGKMPKRQTDGAIGYDAYLRAIVCPYEMDPNNDLLRRTLFDFENCPIKRTPAEENSGGFNHFCCKQSDSGEWTYELRPGDSVLVGIGFITRMPFPLLYWMAPRSGLASKYSITIGNAPGTVDPDYRGEVGAIVKNTGTQSFVLERNMRIVQIVFSWAPIPQITEVQTHAEMVDTKRGSGGFGSTGIR